MDKREKVGGLAPCPLLPLEASSVGAWGLGAGCISLSGSSVLAPLLCRMSAIASGGQYV